MDDDFKEFLEGQLIIDDTRLNEDTEAVHRALVNIKEEYQDVIIWYYVDELSVPQIAKIMDKSQGAIRVLIHRGLKALKEHLEETE